MDVKSDPLRTKTLTGGDKYMRIKFNYPLG